MLSPSQLESVVKQTKAIVKALDLYTHSESDRAAGAIAAALIMSLGMETVSDVGPALKQLAATSSEMAETMRNTG